MGRFLEQTRIEKGLSRPELSRLSGICENTIYNLEHGRCRSASIISYQKLCNALEIKLSDVIKQTEK